MAMFIGTQNKSCQPRTLGANCQSPGGDLIILSNIAKRPLKSVKVGVLKLRNVAVAILSGTLHKSILSGPNWLRPRGHLLISANHAPGIQTNPC